MNKQDLINTLAKYTLTKSDAKNFVNFIFNTIVEALTRGEKVHIQNLGTFIPKFYKAKKMYDPKRKKYVLVSPRHKIKFIVSKKLISLLNTRPE